MHSFTFKLSTTFGGLLICATCIASPLTAEQDQTIRQLMERYQSQGADIPSVEAGNHFWHQQGPSSLSCASCHGKDLTIPGKHIRTKRVIDPMSANTNPDRLASKSKVEKWLKRNCKSVWKRECSATEKANILAWLATQ